MEIRQYLYAIRRRLWIVILLPLVAATAATGYLARQPEKFQSTAVVVVPSLSGKGYSTSAVTQYFSTFKDVLISTPVVADVSRKTGASQLEITANLTAVTASASSNIINVTYTGTNRSQVGKVAELASRESLDALMQPQLSAAQWSLATAQAEQRSAGDALLGFTKETGLLAPDMDYRLKSNELSQFTQQLEAAKLAGDAPRIAGLKPLIAQRQKDLQALSAQLIRFQRLDDAYKSSTASVGHAQQQVQDITAVMASDATPSAVTASPAERISRLSAAVKAGGIAGAVGLVLALSLVVLIELVRPTRLAAVESATGATPDTATGRGIGTRPVVAVAAPIKAANGDTPLLIPVTGRPSADTGATRVMEAPSRGRLLILRCSRCGWRGDFSRLTPRTVDDIMSGAGCPNCQTAGAPSDHRHIADVRADAARHDHEDNGGQERARASQP